VKHGDDEEQSGNGREPLDEHDRVVSDLVVKINEPDIYTPTLDLSDDPAMQARHDLLRQAATKPGVRRRLRTSEQDLLEMARAKEDVDLLELRTAVEQYEKDRRSFFWWVLPLLVAVTVAITLAILFSSHH